MRLLLILFMAHCSVSYAESIDSLRAALEQQAGATRVSTLLELADYYTHRNSDSALMFAEDAMKLAENLNFSEGIGNSRLRCADFHKKGGDNERAIMEYSSAARVFNEMNLMQEVAMCYYKTGLCYKDLALYDSALISYEKALPLFRDENDRMMESKLLGEMGYIFYAMGDYPGAIDYYQRALKTGGEAEDKNSALINQRIGSVYYNLENFPKAMEYYKIALVLRKKNNDFSGLASTLNNIGNVYRGTKEYDTALTYYYQALEINKQLENLNWQSVNLNNIGVIYKDKGLYDQALDYYFQSLEIKEKLGSKRGLVWTLSNISTVYAFKGEYKKAIEYYSQSLDIAREIGLKAQILNSYKEMAELYSYTGDFENAFRYSQMYNSLHDSVFNEDKIKAITEIQTKYETEKKEKENELLRKEAEIQGKVNLFQKIALGGLVVLSVLLLILFYVARRSSIKNRLLLEQEKKLSSLELQNKEMEKQRLEEIVFAEQQINQLQKEKIEYKSRELSTVTLHILAKNQVLENIRNEMVTLRNSKDQGSASNCEKILSLIEGDHVLDQDWDQFKKHFEEVHPEFFKRINETFEGLTSNDTKLCAYLKINLTTKEMARMLNVTIAAINKSRQRLRKKLNIGSEADLVEFINSL